MVEEDKPMRVLVIMRGIPGAGKTHWVKANLLGLGAKIISADTYMRQWGGFNPLRLKEAHDRCYVDCKLAMERSGHLIVLDNTNIKSQEYTRYYRLALDYDYEIRVIRVVCDPEIAAARNVHGVPLATIKRMSETLARDPLGGEEIQGNPEGSGNGLQSR